MLLQTDSLRVQHTKVALTSAFSGRMTCEVTMLQFYDLQEGRPVPERLRLQFAVKVDLLLCLPDLLVLRAIIHDLSCSRMWVCGP